MIISVDALASESDIGVLYVKRKAETEALRGGVMKRRLPTNELKHTRRFGKTCNERTMYGGETRQDYRSRGEITMEDF